MNGKLLFLFRSSCYQELSLINRARMTANDGMRQGLNPALGLSKSRTQSFQSHSAGKGST